MESYMQPSPQELRVPIKPHQFSPGEVQKLYHVYDDCSQTQLSEVGIVCGNSCCYISEPQNDITVTSILRHLDWSNRCPTPFISFYDNRERAFKEANRRRKMPVWWRDRMSVKVAEIQLTRDSAVWVFSKKDLLCILGSHPDISRMADRSEWFAWGVLPEEYVVGLWFLESSGNWSYQRLKNGQ
ncbi:uncharacterized protein K452DRAFT_286000 [Aplosporella prunicola CBS 121167]|uniref:DUF7587 domain-containing protein n=1 Tax=Aplosporella prunicola CBS 121167 TaxID=1176127 RepID=A0A6A6BG88_9PEZI|nr:uncharacterized protein K452DRAFT_286000 [Aplosporella prunicola CBS 121167]KAF2143149.1 hypothetical protein K452DRAFT_286000 [Aplosporella prunicola CBS 121167]